MLLAPLLLALFSPFAIASSFMEQPFPDTVKNSPQIVRGKIGKSETQWTTLPDGSKHLFTYYDVEVTEGLKGKPKPGSPIRIRELGGEKGGTSVQISGTAHFGTGEDVVVMLGEATESGDRAYPVMGMMMGKFNVEKGPDGKEYLKGPGLGSSLHPALRNENSPSGSQTKVSLEALRETIRSQALLVTASSTPVPSVKPLNEPLLASRANSQESALKQVGNEGLTETQASKKSTDLKPIILIVGIVIGTLWFLNSKKKRR